MNMITKKDLEKKLKKLEKDKKKYTCGEIVEEGKPRIVYINNSKWILQEA